MQGINIANRIIFIIQLTVENIAPISIYSIKKTNTDIINNRIIKIKFLIILLLIFKTADNISSKKIKMNSI